MFEELAVKQLVDNLVRPYFLLRYSQDADRRARAVAEKVWKRIKLYDGFESIKEGKAAVKIMISCAEDKEECFCFTYPSSYKGENFMEAVGVTY